MADVQSSVMLSPRRPGQSIGGLGREPTPGLAAEARRAMPFGMVDRNPAGAMGRDGEHKPMSARQRKQVYMSSSLFETGGAPTTPVYNVTRQADIHGQLKHCLSVPPRKQGAEIRLPSPRDCKLTVNAGHGGAILPSDQRECSNERTRFGGQADPEAGTYGTTLASLRLIRAAEDGAIPKEFKATHTNLNWMDTRSESATLRRGQDFHTARKTMDASTLKRQELSSEVFGARHVEVSPRRRKDSEVNESGSALEARRPVSARVRAHLNLAGSDATLFSSRPQFARSVSPPIDRTNLWGEAEDSITRVRRRTERNYSDIFGSASASTSRRKGPREEILSTSKCSWLDQAAEVASRNLSRRSPSPTPSGGLMGASEESKGYVTVWDPPWVDTGDRRETSPHERLVHKQERACWDTTTLMDCSSEITRRNRERVYRDGSPAKSPSTSAAHRKRVELASGQFRQGTGSQKMPWDDGRLGPGPPEPIPSMAYRSTLQKGRHTSPGCPRATKVQELSGSGDW